MANWSDPRSTAAPFGATDTRAAAYDAGLRSYMLSVYNYMTSGVLLTAIVALLFNATGMVDSLSVVGVNSHGQLVQSLSGLGWIVSLAPLAIVFAMSFGQRRFSAPALQLMFFAYAGLLGASLSTLFQIYTDGSIAMAFFATGAGFAGLSLWGYTTKRDLSGFGSFLIIGLVGIIVAMLLNAFVFRSGVMDLVISIVGVLVFAGLTAYDTQKIKSMYDYVAGTEWQGKTAIMGALNLYLDFINMFLFILRIFGSQRN